MNRPQVTLRDLFWLVLVVALGVGWWTEHRKPVQQVHPVQIGRDQFTLGDKGEFVLLDSTTGQVWRYEETSGAWWKLGSPPK